MLAPGSRIGPYEIRSLLGSGGMGEVYRAYDARLRRDVIIKILPRADGERLSRFEREAHLLAALNHPNIGAIHGIDDYDGVPALILELVEGEIGNRFSKEMVGRRPCVPTAFAAHNAVRRPGPL